jgi:hydrogenase nickel incorporation protein HypA/HybF
MHELSITQSILEIALRHAQRAGGPRITDIYLVIGRLSSVVDDSVQFYWDLISEDSLAEGAELHFRRIPAELRCRQCGRGFSPDEGLTCPGCGSSRIRVAAGDEFYVESIGVSAHRAPSEEGAG